MVSTLLLLGLTVAAVVAPSTALPACSTEVSGSVATSTSMLVAQQTGAFTQNLYITNTGRKPLKGDVVVVLENLPASVALANRTGVAACGGDGTVKAFVNVNSDERKQLNPGETAIVPLEFLKTTPSVAIRFKAVVYADSGVEHESAQMKQSREAQAGL